MTMKDFQNCNFTRVYNEQVLDWLSADPCKCIANICMIKKTPFGLRIVKGQNIKLKDLVDDNIFVQFAQRGVEDEP